MAKLWGKPCNFLNIKVWVKREKAILQNSNSTHSIELPRCGPLWLKMRDLITDFQIRVKTEQVLWCPDFPSETNFEDKLGRLYCFNENVLCIWICKTTGWLVGTDIFYLFITQAVRIFESSSSTHFFNDMFPFWF